MDFPCPWCGNRLSAPDRIDSKSEWRHIVFTCPTCKKGVKIWYHYGEFYSVRLEE